MIYYHDVYQKTKARPPSTVNRPLVSLIQTVAHMSYSLNSLKGVIGDYIGELLE